MSEVKRYDGKVSHSDEGGYVSLVDYTALKAERDALAAENLARGEIIWRLIGQYSAAGYHAVQNSLNPAQSLLYDAMQVLKTPATDAYANRLRAEGVEIYWQNVLDENQKIAADAGFINAVTVFEHMKDEAKVFAANLRKDGE